MELQNIVFEVRDKTAWIKVDRPKFLNALNGTTFAELSYVLDKIEKDDKIVCVVITGAGEKAFVAGADLGEIANLGLKEALAYSKRGQHVFGRIEKLGKPVIAAINGLAIGGGLELALSCPLRIMSESAKVGLPELGLGGIPGFGGTQRLPRLVGKSRAVWYILTGEMIDASKAVEIGLVHKVVPAADLGEECTKLAGLLAQKSPMAMRLALQAINSGFEIDLEAGLTLEGALMTISRASSDAKEGLDAFFQKRKPEFTGD
jgi:enoyl-CoA hydratase